ncbi:MAG: BrnA antitoxin family protein [Lachnospiraceae bacterium]|nr:BrnA antitoxin family protein [Lachnospiraceae bacterium]
MKMVSYELKPETKLSEEQEKMLSDAEKRPVVSDEDCPELTEEELAQFYRVSEKRREEHKKQTVTLRLSPQALKTAKSLGKGYTSVLSRILESALRDKEVIQRYL